MNFYKHHLGDYDGDTAHLSWDEDMAYTRLLRAYYRREKPIPPTEAYRLSRATSKAQREAVDRVLDEFFEQREDGWHNKRADEEIATYQAQASTNRRIARERTVPRIVNESSTNRTTIGPPNQNIDKEKQAEPDGSLDAIWAEGISVLVAQGLAEKNARAFIGMLCKRHEVTDVADAFQSAIGKADAKGYVLGILKTKPLKTAGKSRAVFD